MRREPSWYEPMSPASTSTSAPGATTGSKRGWTSRCRSESSWIFIAGSTAAVQRRSGTAATFVPWERTPRDAGRSVDRLDHVLYDLLRVAEDHHRLVQVEQLVVESRVARGHAALVHD